VAKDPNQKPTPEFTTTNPSVNPDTGQINPSAPTVGTEAWGTTTDERRTLSKTEPSATQSRQVRADAGDGAESSRRTRAAKTSMNITRGGPDRTDRCADAGNADRRWETSGATEEEIMDSIREHTQTVHGWNDWTDAIRTRVSDSIRERRAA
jgi:predicted small metal-binding protein